MHMRECSISPDLDRYIETYCKKGMIVHNGPYGKHESPPVPLAKGPTLTIFCHNSCYIALNSLQFHCLQRISGQHTFMVIRGGVQMKDAT